MLQQQLAVAAVLGFRRHGQTGQLATIGRVGKSLHSNAAVNPAVMLQYGKIANMSFQIAEAAAQQNARLFQRPYHGNDIRNIAAFGRTDTHKRILRDRGARTVAGKQFANQGTVVQTGKDLAAADTFADGIQGGIKQIVLTMADTAAFQTAFRFFSGKVRQQAAVFVQNAILPNQEQQLVRFQGDGGGFGNFRHAEIEQFAARGGGQRIQ